MTAPHSAISQVEPQVFAGRSQDAERLWVRGGVFCLAGVLGLAFLTPVLRSTWHLWVTDPLRSIGGLVALMSVVLILREWRRLGWESRPTWWGLAPLALATASLMVRPVVVTLQSQRWNSVSLRGGLSVNLVPDGLVIVMYVSAFLLMLGGVRVLRKALLPLLLLLLVNPVPSFFSSFDLPLQHMSASIAYRFAALIGEHPTGTQLRLMFTPDFGMFIAPGCDGIRGAVALAYLGLFATFWKDRPISFRAVAAITGLALGYLLNFVRLCVLVIYYKLGESIKSIQPYGAIVDYVIGGTLFFLASIFCWRLFFGDPVRTDTVAREAVSGDAIARGGKMAIAVFLGVSIAVGLANLQAFASGARAERLSGQGHHTEPQLPATIGKYHLASTWDEYLTGNFRAYRWGRYADGQPNDDVLLGLWGVDSDHNAVDCHLSRAEEIEAGNDIVHRGPDGNTTLYNTFSYDDGLTRVFVASTVCRKCFGAPKMETSYGRLTVALGQRTDHLNSQFVGAMLIKHEGDAPGAKDSQPVRDFIANLDERQFMDGQVQ